MHVAQFIHRYPPALGGAESYAARLCEFLADRGDDVRVWTTTAVGLNGMWSRTRSRLVDEVARPAIQDSPSPRRGPIVTRYRPLGFPARRYVLKALPFPFRQCQCLTSPCNQSAKNVATPERTTVRSMSSMPRRFRTHFRSPAVCAARGCGVPFFITPFLHLGDPEDSLDPTRRQYTAPHLRWLLCQADGAFV